MKKFLNKITNEIEKADDFTKLFAFSHNSNYVEIEENIEIGKKACGRKSKKGDDDNEIQKQEN